MSELVMDQRIVWDSNNLKQVDEAKARIMSFVRSGYKVLLPDGNPMERFRPHYEEVLVLAQKTGRHIMKILTDKGDERLVWDKNNGPQAMEAKEKFVSLLGRGYKAYSVDANGKKKRKITEFDVDAEEILLVPQTVGR